MCASLLEIMNDAYCIGRLVNIALQQQASSKKMNNVKHAWLTEDSYFYSDGKAHLKQGYC